MTPHRALKSWLGRPVKHPRRGLLVERLEDRLTPSGTDKVLAQPIRLDTLATTQDLLARTSSTNPLSDLANVVNHLNLGSVVDVARSSVVLPGTVQIHLKDGVAVRTAATTLMSTGLYTSVAPNYIFALADLREAIPNDPQFTSQFPHSIIDAPRAWDTTVGSSSVVVAILDDGLDVNHSDLLANVWINAAEVAGDGLDNDGNGYIDDTRGWNFLGNNSLVTPDDTAVDLHGTQIAGVLAARINNSLGIAGVAGGSRIMPLKVVGNGATTSLTIIRAINYAVDNGAKIINSSLNIDPFLQDPSFRAAVSRAYDAGLLWVNSAGNLNLQDPARAALTDMLIVGATDRGDQKTSYSNYGWGLDLAAPGGSSTDAVFTTTPNGYGTAWGTSISAPLVAGTAALLWSLNPSWTRDQVVNAILANADNLDSANPNFLDKLGTGRLDAGASVGTSSFVTKLGRLYEMPEPGEDAPAGFDSFRLRLQGNLDPDTVTLANFELRWAGIDNTFDTLDDRVVSLNLAGGYQYGTNSLDFTFQESLSRGLYRFTAKSGGLRDPFHNPVDGDANGTAGGNLVRYFGNPILAQGVITGDIDEDGPTSTDPGVGGVGVFPDFNNNGLWDTTTIPSSSAPIAIADENSAAPAVIDLPVSGFTRPVNFISVHVVLIHPSPADLVISLKAPDGRTVTLMQNRPLPADVPTDRRIFEFADDIVESIVSAPGEVIYRLKPDQALAGLYGGNANGVWQVIVVDTTPGDSGTLLSAAITIGEEPLALTNAAGAWSLPGLPAGPITIRILPPDGWRSDDEVKINGYLIDTRNELPQTLQINLTPSDGIVGRVHQNGSGAAGFLVYLDGNGNQRFDNSERSAITDANGVYKFDNLPQGTFTVRIAATSGYMVPAVGQTVVLTPGDLLSSGHDFAVIRDTAPVRVNLIAVVPALRTTAVRTISFELSEIVDGLTIADIRLARDGVVISLVTATVIGDGTRFTLIGLEPLTSLDGTYTLTILAPAPAGAPNRRPVATTTTWTLDTQPPQATLTPLAGAGDVVDVVTVRFNSPVNGFDLADFILLKDGIAVSLDGVSLSATATPNEFTLTNLSTVATAAGRYSLQLKAGSVVDSAGNALSGSVVADWTVPELPAVPRPLPPSPQPVPRVRYTAVAAGDGSSPTVIVYAADGGVARTITPFELNYTGGVRVATGDVNGDGVDDIIVAPGRNTLPRVKIYDGKTGLVLNEFLAFEAGFRGGLLVAAGDLTGDGRAEIIVTPDKGGGPRVRVFEGINANVIADFFGIDDATFRGGARAALGDINGDNRLDLIVSAGTGGGPRVAAFDGITVAANKPVKLFGDFLAFEPSLRNGASIGAADLDGDGRAEILASAADGGGPRFTAFSGASLLVGQYRRISDFFIGDENTRGGLRIAVEGNEVFIGSGSGTIGRVRVYDAASLLGDHDPLREFDPFGDFLGGIFLG